MFGVVLPTVLINYPSAEPCESDSKFADSTFEAQTNSNTISVQRMRFANFAKRLWTVNS